MGKTEIAPQIDWNKDKLGIKDNVIGFANILKQEKYTQDGTSKVYSISAEFGIGKTFFCEHLQDVLKQDGIPVSMLNIWKMDFYENPLVPLLINLQQTYTMYSNTPEAFPNPKKLLNMFKSLVAGISVEAHAPLFGKIVIDGEKIINCHENLKNTEAKNSIYTEYKQFETELNNLKSFLGDWAKSMNKPIVIIIDELDRCRPDYAVKTLEILKHFFDIKGFVFVLAIDEEQLKNSVETLFGTKNFDGYKRKFINNSFILPAPNKVKFTDFLYDKSGLSNVVKQIESCEKDLVFKTVLKDMELRYVSNDPALQKERDYNNSQTSEQIIKHYFAAYSIWFKFSLRQMEQIFDRLVLFSKYILNCDELYSPDLAVFLICLHEFDLAIYNKLRSSSSKVYGQHGGLLKHIYSTNKTEASLARVIYKDDSDTMFDTLDRNLIPKVPEILGFSAIGSFNQQHTVIIHDNVDRFFVAEESQQHPLTWIVEIQDHETGKRSMAQNNGRVAVITNSKRDAAWKEPPADVDTATQFDLEQFRKDYFDKTDFILNFK
nr:hypothetical protein [Candidatus Enterousia merdequi]